MAALTTIFTPPSSCFGGPYTADGTAFVKDLSIASTDCYPSAFHSLFTNAIPYSPGVCPSGYGAAATAIAAGSDNEAATTAWCCPSGMTASPPGLGCYQEITTSTELRLSSGTTTISSGELAMHAVYVAWASSDLSLFTPASAPIVIPTTAAQQPSRSAPTVSSAASTFASVASPESSQRVLTTTVSALSPTVVTTFVSFPSAPFSGGANNSPAPESGSASLSGGTIAGIVVGAVIGLALVAVALVAYLFRNKWRRKAQGTGNVPDIVDPLNPEKDRSSIAKPLANHARHISELSSDSGRLKPDAALQPSELEATLFRAELEGNGFHTAS